MEKKLLVICGATATGKTSLALSLAKKLASGPEGSSPAGELISADSRQVYKGMDIGTGKELPINSKLKTPSGSELPPGRRHSSKLKYGFYIINKVKVWGYDLVDPDENFSVSQYIKIAREAVKDIWRHGNLPIIVGGTGFYIKALLDGIASADVTPDKRLRKSLEKKSTEELFELLAGLDPIRAASMNTSDKKNPRRLTRAIEIVQARVKPAYKKGNKLEVDKVLIMGLSAPRAYLDKRIGKRVKERLDEGFENEAVALIERGISWKTQAMHSLGYKQFRPYYEGKVTKKEFVSEWVREEKRYAKRQMTWFKKDKRIVWFDVSKSGWKAGIEKLLRNW